MFLIFNPCGKFKLAIQLPVYIVRVLRLKFNYHKQILTIATKSFFRVSLVGGRTMCPPRKNDSLSNSDVSRG